MIPHFNKEETQTQIEKYLLLNIYQRRDCILKELEENEAFFTGIVTGINLYQSKVVMAHDRKEAIIIGDNLYYIQSGRERLEEAIDKICK
jgi:hypothetical protein